MDLSDFTEHLELANDLILSAPNVAFIACLPMIGFSVPRD